MGIFSGVPRLTCDRVGILSAPKAQDTFGGRPEITALQFHRSGLGKSTPSVRCDVIQQYTYSKFRATLTMYLDRACHR